VRSLGISGHCAPFRGKLGHPTRASSLTKTRKPNDQFLVSMVMAKSKQISALSELWAFLRARKKWWLGPIILVMLLFGGLLVLAQGSVVAPFIYTLF
jgi:Family of unknown function (DUF5989)